MAQLSADLKDWLPTTDFGSISDEHFRGFAIFLSKMIEISAMKMIFSQEFKDFDGKFTLMRDWVEKMDQEIKMMDALEDANNGTGKLTKEVFTQEDMWEGNNFSATPAVFKGIQQANARMYTRAIAAMGKK